jgi:hypothetical protein
MRRISVIPPAIVARHKKKKLFLPVVPVVSNPLRVVGLKKEMRPKKWGTSGKVGRVIGSSFVTVSCHNPREPKIPNFTSLPKL